ncbi:MAG TPA: 50S ribosomal protein L24 [Bacteroidia bacterium]|nr:50S ribosomal protein L24 [Sphingobacteriales bacterium]HPD65683.1 50S ribosomal protein L24 [Bacteroidia bacterium]HRS58997.1 50S ribosomal protein L24 [Bacteroidia bacterium]HRU68123.1 50S ribosomal protein L24 [Bacteroidia bacterium]
MKKDRIDYKPKIKKGDTVMVISGNYKGKTGRVLEVIYKEERAIVEGINIISKHTKPNQKNTEGGIIKKEAPIHLSKLMVVDPKTNQPTRVGRKLNEKNILVRYSKKSGEVIDK